MTVFICKLDFRLNTFRLRLIKVYKTFHKACTNETHLHNAALCLPNVTFKEEHSVKFEGSGSRKGGQTYVFPLSDIITHLWTLLEKTDERNSSLFKEVNDMQNKAARLLLILTLSGRIRGLNIRAAVASWCVSLCMFSSCKSLLWSLWRILLNYKATDNASLNICSFRKLKKFKKDEE